MIFYNDIDRSEIVWEGLKESIISSVNNALLFCGYFSYPVFIVTRFCIRNFYGKGNQLLQSKMPYADYKAFLQSCSQAPLIINLRDAS